MVLGLSMRDGGQSTDLSSLSEGRGGGQERGSQEGKLPARKEIMPPLCVLEHMVHTNMHAHTHRHTRTHTHSLSCSLTQ